MTAKLPRDNVRGIGDKSVLPFYHNRIHPKLDPGHKLGTVTKRSKTKEAATPNSTAIQNGASAKIAGLDMWITFSIRGIPKTHIYYIKHKQNCFLRMPYECTRKVLFYDHIII